MFQRRGTKTQWETTDPVLAVGEIGFSYNENVVKLGDGQKKWTQLPQIGSDSAYEIAKINGFTGTETQWLLSLVGPTGPTGPTGATGPTGLTGAMYPVTISTLAPTGGNDGDLWFRYDA
jgi:hypothetical protein